MKMKAWAIIVAVILLVGTSFSQPGGPGFRPPSIKERLKIVEEKCQELKVDKVEQKKVVSAFKEFFIEMDDLIQNQPNPMMPPDKSKVDALEKARNEKIKQAVSSELYAKFLEIEKTMRPGHLGMKPPTVDERLKMIDEGLCRPLNIEGSKKEKFMAAFKEFFLGMDKLIDLKSERPEQPKPSKVEELERVRNEKVKDILPEELYDKYLELELCSRPGAPMGCGMLR